MFRRSRGFVFKEVFFLLHKEVTYRDSKVNVKSLPALSRLGSFASWLSCAMLILVNMADPYFVSINCTQDLLMHVMCANEGNDTFECKNETYPPPHICHTTDLQMSPLCLTLVWKNLTWWQPTQCLDPKHFSFVFQAVQAKTSPPLIFSQKLKMNYYSVQGLVTVKYYNFLNYSLIPQGDQDGGFCAKTYQHLPARKTGGNVFNCSYTFKTGTDSYFAIESFCQAEQLCFGQQKEKSSCECQEGDPIDTKCKYVTKPNGRRYCSPLFNATVSGDCQLFVDSHHQSNTTQITERKRYRCNNTHFISGNLVDDLVEDCMFTGDDENVLLSMLSQSTYHTCKYQQEIPCREGHSRCFNNSQICQYKLNSLGYLEPCRTGEHMQNCSTFVCNMQFKCRNSHCIPWEYVCDGKWDCSDGCDESTQKLCRNTRICTNSFKCKLSQICVHLGTICDSQWNCPHGDDEQLCDLNHVFCPDKCKCVTLAVYCIGSQFHYCSAKDLFSFHVIYLKKALINTRLVTPHVSTIDISESEMDKMFLCYWLNHGSDSIKHLRLTSASIHEL